MGKLETGPYLRDLRERAGATMLDLADRLKMHEPALSLIERGRRPVPDEDFASRYKSALVEITRERHDVAQQALTGAVGS